MKVRGTLRLLIETRRCSLSHTVFTSLAYPVDWMSDCVDTAERLLPLLEPQHLSNIFWALAKLEYHPGKSKGPYISTP